MMFLPLPTIEPRDSHALWYTPSQPTRHSSKPAATQSTSHNASSRRSANTTQRQGPPATDSLAALILEERALRIRKQNIASFGFSWIRPAGYPKTMMGIREEEMEREESGNGAGMEFIAEEEDWVGGGGEGQEGLEALERDLDGEIPDAEEMVSEGDEEEDEEGRGLVERGEGEFQDDDEEGFMERDLDDDIPDAFGAEYDDDDDEEGDEDEERDLDDDIPSASDDMNFGAYDDDDEDDENLHEQDEEEEDFDEEEMQEDSIMARNLDSDVPSPIDEEHQEWEHTDTDADLDDEDDDIDIDMSLTMDVDPRRQSLPHHNLNLRSSMSVSGLPEPIPHIPQPRQETEAERLFIDRYSGGGSLVSSDLMPEPSLRIPRRRTRRYSVPSEDDDDGIL